ncbi:MAG: PVC-type heme-binding CxxCH protein [Verrucomicrobiales bacterium]
MNIIKGHLLLTACLVPLSVAPAEPELLDDRYKLTLFAESPDLSTPIGCAIDGKGRVLVIESHTHFRPEGYIGPKEDRILALSDTDGDGKADSKDIYFEGGTHTMSITRGGSDTFYVATRSEVFRLKDENKDGRADSRETLVTLKTPGKYPHNGLCGLALTSDRSKLYFGLGENLGKPYEIVSQTGAKEITRMKGGGEGGNIYSYDLRTGLLVRIATGFWNPFGICLTPEGRMFCVDNDPDARPHNRLLRIVPGGDYGYQYRYGRSGIHPLQAWDGELPGTLPMICGTGEAACSVIPHGERLWVTSWANGRVEEYRLRQDGSNYTATMKVIIKGGPDFRPVDFAHAEDGSVYFTDWVDASYQLHGKGRLWKLTPVDGKTPKPGLANPLAGEESRKELNNESLRAINEDRFALATCFWHRARSKNTPELEWHSLSENAKVALLTATRWKEKENKELLTGALGDPSENVRIAAVRIIGDGKIIFFRDKLSDMLPSAVRDSQLYRTVAAALKELGD